jgi:hypothetical protein
MDCGEPSTQPTKRQRVSELTRERPGPQPTAASQYSSPHTTRRPTVNAGAIESKTCAESSYGTQASQTEKLVKDVEVQVDIQSQINATMANHFWMGSIRQTMVWEELREGLITDVETVGDEDRALELLVEKYQQDLTESLGASFNLL